MNALIIIIMCAAAGPWLEPPPRLFRDPAEGRGTRGERVRARLRLGRGGGKQNLHRDEAAIFGAALTSVAARLRAGQSPHAAWHDVADTLPAEISVEVRHLGTGAAALSHQRVKGPALIAAEAATRLAHELGAELAPVLEACAGGIEESTRARAERDAAFAGPRATARLLLALPLAGVGLGTLMGARPLALFTSTIWGAFLGIAAAILLLVGRWWIRQLLHHARTAGEGIT